MVEQFYGMEQTRVRFPVAPQGPLACGPHNLGGPGSNPGRCPLAAGVLGAAR